MKSLIRTSFAALRAPQIWGLQLLGNAVLLALAALWLLVPEARAWQLVATIVLGLVVIVSALWLHGGTLAYFQASDARDGFRRALRHLAAVAVWVAILLFVLWIVNEWSATRYQYAGYLRSRLSRGARGTVSVGGADATITFGFALLMWYIVPVVLLPFLAQAAQHGFRLTGMRTALRSLGRLSYWVTMAPLAIIAAFLPQALAGWVRQSTLTLEAISMVLRLGAAYLIAVAVWLAAASVLGSTARLVRPAVDQTEA